MITVSEVDAYTYTIIHTDAPSTVHKDAIVASYTYYNVGGYAADTRSFASMYAFAIQG